MSWFKKSSLTIWEEDNKHFNSVFKSLKYEVVKLFHSKKITWISFWDSGKNFTMESLILAQDER